MQRRSYVVPEEFSGVRLDKVLAALSEDLSRARLQALIKEGNFKLNGAVCGDGSRKVVTGDCLDIQIPEVKPAEPEAQDIEISVVYEDEDVLVINKPAGLVVHPGAGNPDGTLVNALLAHCEGELSGIGGVARPGIVHRLDKDTSGLMIAAKHDEAHQGLSAQLEDRTLYRTYKALVLKTPLPPYGTIDLPIGRHRNNRVKMAIMRRGGRDASTHYRVVKDYGGAVSLLECRLETGRTHQIRVHMEAKGHPLIGDPLYVLQPTALRAAMKKVGYEAAVIDALLAFPRQALHAETIGFIHPVSGEEMQFTAPLPADFLELLNLLK